MTTVDNVSLDHTLPAETKLYYDLKLPAQKPGPLLLALHGYGANKKQMMREAQQMAPDDFVIASLQGFHQHMREPREVGGPLRFGFGWLTNFRPEESVAMHHKALLDLIGRLTNEGVVDAERIFLLGFSQSCALNYRFAFTHADLLRGVVGICGGIPGDWATSESYKPTKTAVLHLAGSRDQFYPPERVSDYQDQLGVRSRSVVFKTYDATHEIIPDMRVDVKGWLVQHVRL
jgi:phospholipase/carboxylesterase